MYYSKRSKTKSVSGVRTLDSTSTAPIIFIEEIILLKALDFLINLDMLFIKKLIVFYGLLSL